MGDTRWAELCQLGQLVGEGCPYRSVQQFAYELLNLAQPGQLPAGFVERAIQAAQLLDPALLSTGSNP